MERYDFPLAPQYQESELASSKLIQLVLLRTTLPHLDSKTSAI